MTGADGVETLWQVFAASARLHPRRCALELPPAHGRSRRIQLSYAELEIRAGEIAAALLDADPDPGEKVVALLLPRSGPDLLAAQLAAGLLGRPWTQLDPGQPEVRLRHVVADSAVATILCSRDLAALAEGLGAPPIVCDDVARGMKAPTPRAGPASAAYIIYTSGTTGRPKGVVIEEHSIVNLVLSDVDTFKLGPHDRVAQGSSAAYDSYLEEVWLALAVGAAVVVLDDETLRLGPDLPDFLRREEISVLCPPPTLLRGMACRDPRSELPDIRLLYVGGEPLPSDVATAWAPGRRLENGYGPTECCVTVMRTTIRTEDPITIGGPIRGHRALVLDEELRELPAGEVGELAIAGPGLARGYLGRPALTAEKFPEHPDHGRIYRTGDLVRVDDEGRHHYLGRADSQVKIRGHRIELEEIEAQLATRPDVREAACRLSGGRILAWLVAEPDLDLEALRRFVTETLPEPMHPTAYGLLADLPRTTGGKIDRRALPDVEVAELATGETSADARTALVQEAFRRALDRPGPPPAEADFFGELGGHSLAAALAVSILREDPRGRAITVRALYENPSATRLGALLGEPREATTLRDLPPRPRGRPVLLGAMQVLFLLCGLVAASAIFSLLVARFLPEVLGQGSLPLDLATVVLALAGLSALIAVLSFPLAIAGKWLLMGRYVPGRCGAFGLFRLRHWLTRGLVGALPFGLLRGSGLELGLLRLLGARVGRGVMVDRGVDLMRGGWDLLEIGDDAVLGRDAEIRPIILERGEVVLGHVRIGARAVLESRAGMAPASVLGEAARLGALSYLESGAEIAPGRRAEGVPAQAVADEETTAAQDGGLGPFSFGLALLGARALMGLILAAPALVYGVRLALDLGLDDPTTGNGLFDFLGSADGLMGLALWLAALIAMDLVLRAGLCRLLGRPVPGRHPRRSWSFIRHDLQVGLVEGAGRTLSGTMFWPSWLNAAGMRIGPGCEISSIMEVAPGLVTIGAGSFFADGIYLGGPRHEPGIVEFRPTTVGSGVFLGNHAVLPGGTTLPDDVLLGIATPAPREAPPPGSSWFGHPAFELPRRELVEVDRSLTHDPTLPRRLSRFIWEALRFFLPWPPIVIGLLLLALLLDAQRGRETALLHLAVAPGLFATAATALLLLVLGLKWLLLGRTKPGRHPLWSCWCSRWDYLYVVWQAWATPLLRPLEGSFLLAWWLRAMGVRIGRRVLLGDGFTQVVDPDMLVIDDDATVEGLFQAHSFEDRVLKVEPLRIRAGADTGFGSVMLYGADLGCSSRLAPHSVAMKHERLYADADHVGCPTSPRPRRHCDD